MTSVAVIPGDGIGKEVIPPALRVMEALVPDLEIVMVEAGLEKWKKTGAAITAWDLEVIKSCRCVLLGAVTTPPDPDYKSVVLTIRKELDLYANIRPFKSWKKSGEFDFVIVRENTEGLYSGLEETREDQATTTRLITRKGCRRIAEAACKIASQRISEGKGGKITIVHKANVLKSDRFFRSHCQQVIQENRLEYNEMLVDSTAYNMVLQPQRFQVILTSNLFGDILSDLAAALTGGLGLSPSANLGDHHALFEPVHGSAPDIAGQNRANPIAAILSVKMMLDWMKETKKAEKIQKAVENTLNKGIRTPDLQGKNTTEEVANQILKELENL